MDKTISYFIILLFSLLILNCSHSDNSDDVKDTEQVESLTGKWQWLRSTGSIAGITITPESSGRTMKIEFTEDSTFNKYVDNMLVYTSPFILQKQDSTIRYTTLAIFEGVGLGFDHQPEQRYSITKDKILLLIDPCCDNFTFEFVKLDK